MRKLLITLLLTVMTLSTYSQVGEHRDDLRIGFSGGYVLSNMQFTPKVTQSMHGGLTGGFTVRYTCEKYFKSICAIQAEINYAQIGWKEKILDANDVEVKNADGEAMRFSRTINYLQVPIMAHLGWGREDKGMQFFFQAGPQIGLYISDSSDKNFEMSYALSHIGERSNQVVAQDTMAIENKFDYGITAGVGAEYSIPHAGHFILEARYYYGLGNIYGNSKRDYFGRSNFNNIVIKMTYLFDITRTKNKKNKN